MECQGNPRDGTGGKRKKKEGEKKKRGRRTSQCPPVISISHITNFDKSCGVSRGEGRAGAPAT